MLIFFWSLFIRSLMVPLPSTHSSFSCSLLAIQAGNLCVNLDRAAEIAQRCPCLCVRGWNSQFRWKEKEDTRWRRRWNSPQSPAWDSRELSPVPQPDLPISYKPWSADTAAAGPMEAPALLAISSLPRADLGRSPVTCVKVTRGLCCGQSPRSRDVT